MAANVYDSVTVSEDITTVIALTVNVYDSIELSESLESGIDTNFYMDSRGSAYWPTAPVAELSANFGVRASLAAEAPVATGIGFFGINGSGDAPVTELSAQLSPAYYGYFSVDAKAPVSTTVGYLGWLLSKVAPTASLSSGFTCYTLSLASTAPVASIAVELLASNSFTLSTRAPVRHLDATLSAAFFADVEGTAPTYKGMGTLISGSWMTVSGTAPVWVVEYNDILMNDRVMDMSGYAPVGVMSESVTEGDSTPSELVEADRFNDLILQYERW